jgi:L-histidine N-alpha-methyltransferase
LCHVDNPEEIAMTISRSITKDDCALSSASLRNQFARDVFHGLSQSNKSLPCKYIYDDEGSELFCRIMELSEYYLTDCEKNSLELHKQIITEEIGTEGCNIVELGAGDGTKTEILLDEFLKRERELHYCPIDISTSAVSNLSERLDRKFPGLEINGLVTDYFRGLTWISQQDSTRNVVLFLGSNIGNFSPKEASTFLKHLRESINTGDYLIIGFDLKKDIDTMVRAYNDSEGVTEQFNFNILRRINRELGGQFEMDRFHYRSTWDSIDGAMKSYLISTCNQSVHVSVLDRTFTFVEDEALHTESSYKFTPEQCASMAKEAGFDVIENFFDKRNYFIDSLWVAT